MKLTASNIVKAIQNLPKDQCFEYIHGQTSTRVRVIRVEKPEGPIIIGRMIGSISNDTLLITDHPKNESISSQMIWRIANAFQPNVPINFERVLGSSYNTRSALEALIAHTPEFYWCVPGRIELINNSSKIKRGHKHLVWMPESPHQNGLLTEYKIGNDQAISEIPTQSIVYDSLAITQSSLPAEMDIDVKRRHLQIQIALIEIGYMLGFRTWVAHNDKGFQYGNKRVGELNGVIARLADERVLASYEDAVNAANLIDCIWFKNGKLMPAVMEVEHSTGITSGLTRMKRFQDLGPHLADIRWVIVAADEDRAEVMRKASVEHFQSLNTKFFPYSAVEELYDLCKRRKLSNKAVNEAFLDCFMEPCLAEPMLH